MFNFVSNIILAVRGSNGEDTGWTQLLVLVMVAVVYGLGGLLKARAKKAGKKEQEQPTSKADKDAEPAVQSWGKAQYRKVQQKAASVSPKMRGPVQIRLPRRKVTRPQPAVHKPKVKTDLKGVPEFTSKLPERQGDKYPIGTGEEPFTTAGLTEIFSDYGEGEELKRAILHYEIIGKPLSLRRSSEQLI